MSDSKSEPIVAPVSPADREGLKTEIEEKITEYEKKYADAPPNSKLKGIYLNMIEGLGQKLIEAMSLPGVIPSNPGPGESQYAKSISEAFRRVKPFSGENLEKSQEFLDHLQQIFDVEVTTPDPDGSRDLEAVFMRKVLSNVIQNRVYKHIEANGKMEECSKWTGFKSYINLHFTPKQNAVQVSCKIYDVNWDPLRETLHTPAHKITERVKNGWSALNRQWKEKKKVSTDMPGEDVFNFVGACHLSELIKEHEYDTHRDMIRDLDEVFTVSDVSNKAEYYRVRLKSQNGSNVMMTRHHSARPEKPKHGYGNRDNRRNRSKPEVTEEKPEEKPEGTKPKSTRQKDPEDDSPSQSQAVRYVEPVDWTTRSYHTRVSTHKSESAKESSRALEHGVNGRKRAPLKKPSKGKSKRKDKPKKSNGATRQNGSPQNKTVANQFAIYGVNGEGREGNRTKPDRAKFDPYIPGVSRICYTCAEVLSVCKCDEEPDSDESCLISPAQSRPTSPVQPRPTSPEFKVPSNWTQLFK